MNRSRINWLDTAKFIGIFCIYLGHFSTDAGISYPFVFAFHVPLFFFLSGCAESLGRPNTIKGYFLKNIKKILIPFYLFCLLSVLMTYLYQNCATDIGLNLLLILKGAIRNTFLAGGLWFLSCLFVVKCLFFLIRRFIKKPYLVISICLVCFLFSLIGFTPSMPGNPHWVYNIDSALYYILFYMIGFYCFPFLHKFLLLDSLYKKVAAGILFVLCTFYALATLFGHNLLSFLNINIFASSLESALSALILIGFILGLSKILEDVPLFVAIGQNTLYLCGSEYLIKTLLPLAFQLVGLNIAVQNPLSSYVYTMALLIICQHSLVPVEKAILKKIT